MENLIRFPVISYITVYRYIFYGHEGSFNDNGLKSQLPHFSLGIISNTVFWIESTLDDFVIWTDLDDEP